MTWVKLGDEFCDDSADLSDAAVRTHIDGLAWSARRLLDLHVPKRDLPRFAFSPTATQAVDELITAGWWVDEDSTWHLAHREEWQWSRHQVEQRRYTNAQAQERRRRHAKGDHSLCLPGKCLSAADTPADNADESASLSVPHPVGLGWVGETTHLEEPQTTTDNHREPALACPDCQRGIAFSTGLCNSHRTKGSAA